MPLPQLDLAARPAAGGEQASLTLPRTSSIAGLGYYLPEQMLTNQQLALTVDTNDAWIVERTGIRERHLAGTSEATSDLALRAAAGALEDAGVLATDLDLILVATSTPDAPVPSTGCYLQAKLGCPGIPAMDVAAGCSGFGYALHLAGAAVKAGLHRRVLVVGADCLTRITNYEDRQTCILFGDGAGAVVVAADGFMDVVYSNIGADGTAADVIRIRAGGSRSPASAESVAGHQHKLEMQGRAVFRTAVRQMEQCVRDAAAALGIAVSDFDLIIPHQANARIIEAVGSALEVPREKVAIDVGETGNMASASIPVAMGRARARGDLDGTRLVVVVGFGAGLTWACQVLQLRER